MPFNPTLQHHSRGHRATPQVSVMSLLFKPHGCCVVMMSKNCDESGRIWTVCGYQQYFACDSLHCSNADMGQGEWHGSSGHDKKANLYLPSTCHVESYIIFTNMTMTAVVQEVKYMGWMSFNWNHREIWQQLPPWDAKASNLSNY